jgi:hypothetical protein
MAVSSRKKQAFKRGEKGWGDCGLKRGSSRQHRDSSGLVRGKARQVNLDRIIFLAFE